MSEDNTDKLINSLCCDLKPCEKLRHPLKCTCGWALIAISYTALAIALLGLRPDINIQIHNQTFVFEIFLMLAMGASAALATGWMRFPDMHGRPWIGTIAGTLFSVFVGWTILRGFTEGFIIQPLHFDQCAINAAVFALVPAAAIVFVTKQGTTCCPGAIANMNTLAVTGLGYVGLRLTCASDLIGHTFLYHFLPFIVLGIVLGSVARKLFRW